MPPRGLRPISQTYNHPDGSRRTTNTSTRDLTGVFRFNEDKGTQTEPCGLQPLDNVGFRIQADTQNKIPRVSYTPGLNPEATTFIPGVERHEIRVHMFYE